ncbi:MAG: tetratricopeptide repeat protein [Steroidobacteraceae bacterium]
MAHITLKVTETLLRAPIAAALVVALAALVPAAPVFAQAKPTNSAKLAKPLKEAQEDLKNKKYSEAIAKLTAAEGIAGKTAYDQHLINDFLTFAYVRTQNYPEAAKAMEAEVGDGFLAAADLPQKVRGLAEVNYQIKNYDKAIEFGTRAIKGGYADEELRKLVGQAYYLKGDWKSTLHFEGGLVDSAIKSGATPSSESLQLILSSCVKLDDTQCTTRALERMVTYYPKPDYWYQLLYSISKQTAASDANTLQTFRLMSEVDVLRNPDDYSEMAQLALEAGSPGEAEHILEKAFQKNVFTDQRSKDKNTRLLTKAKQAASVDQATLPKSEKEADAAPTGAKNVGMGIAYLGYQQYDKAAGELSKGISKGGLRNATEAQLLLGIAQLKAGHKEDAVKAFHAVKGDPILERLAGLWALHARQA